MRTWLLLFVALIGLHAGDAPTTAVAGDDLPLRGSGRFTYYLFKIYDVRCYVPAGLAADAVLGEQPRRLSFAYLRAFTAKELAEATTECVDARRGSEPKAEIDAGLAAINALWPAVAKGDVLELHYRPGQGTAVACNGRVLGTVPGAAFARVLFAIWLGSDPIDGDLRRKLLGLR